MTKPKSTPIPPLPEQTGIMPTFGSNHSTDQHFSAYCTNFPDAQEVCQPRTGTLAPYETLTAEKWAILNKVNLDVNGHGDNRFKVEYPKPKKYYDPKTKKTITLTGDEAIYGVDNYEVFANPLSPHFKGPKNNGIPLGDCDDITLAKQHLLIHKYGFKPENVLFAYAKLNREKTYDHAVLLVLTDKGVMVLDNNSDQVQKLEDTTLLIHSVQDRTQPQQFIEMTQTGTISEAKQNGNSFSLNHMSTPHTRQRSSYGYIPDPSKFTITQAGWKCSSGTQGFSYHEIMTKKSITTTIRGLDSQSSVTIEQTRSGTHTISETTFVAKDKTGAELATFTYTPATQKKFSALRGNHPQMQVILKTLADSGIVCSPYVSKFNLEVFPLPAPTSAEKLMPNGLTKQAYRTIAPPL